MAEPNNELFSLDDQARLNRTQYVRDELISKMTETGMPKDNEDRELLLKVLDSSDKAIFGKARAKANQQTANAQKDVTSMMAQVLSRIDVGKVGIANRDTPITLDSNFIADNVVEGETAIGVQNLTYDEFMAEE